MKFIWTFTMVMQLVEKGKLDLDERVRTYLPDFATSQPSVARRVTVRQLLNHSAGWLGEDYQDAGRGDKALARYVRGMERLPQLTPPGEVFAYNNAALVLTGRVIEAVTGSTYEEAVRKLLLDPLGLDHSRFFSDQIIGFNVAASHAIVDGKPVVDPSIWYAPALSTRPAGSSPASATSCATPASTWATGRRRTEPGCSRVNRWWLCAPTPGQGEPCS